MTVGGPIAVVETAKFHDGVFAKVSIFIMLKRVSVMSHTGQIVCYMKMIAIDMTKSGFFVGVRFVVIICHDATFCIKICKSIRKNLIAIDAFGQRAEIAADEIVSPISLLFSWTMTSFSQVQSLSTKSIRLSAANSYR